MEKREILIANTKTQKRSKIETDATTLGELKNALRDAGIDYMGMTFTEGISKTQLLDDATQLPQNVMYKGAPTNNLVILLTNTKKNIASGIGDRATAYGLIKEHGLQEVVKLKFGKNFTQVSTADLWDVIKEAGTVMEESKPGNIGYDREFNDEFEDDEFDDEDYDNVCDDAPSADETKGKDVLSGIAVIIRTLCNNKFVTPSEVREFANHLLLEYREPADYVPSEPVSTSDGSITDDDINDMIDGLGM